ncbi:4-hydroxyphenylacetate 3-hydroxylase C-terminal domain-containing protein [uncultured Amaricoccus sp.]|uniref:4-hydroxyphenylacetate 3-hydroxylase C-terminal domain-containing protein n=1 Tax=uncultured Amaricoccus sp. TaxID=339341 RepID=UPI00260271C3|nr:4-hydroxyphenylacetate 3-hydroxylase C-terminal domain-containing protein [uncultured Amaricoccus sp.]
MIGASCSPSRATFINSDHAGHRLTFQLFAQGPPLAHLAAAHRSFDWDGPLDFVRKSAGLPDREMGGPATLKTAV